MFKIKWQYLVVLFAGIVLGVYLTLYWPGEPAEAKLVVINSRGVSYDVLTEAGDVLGVLAEQSLAVDQASVNPRVETKLQNGMRIEYYGPVEVTVVEEERARQFVSAAKTVGDLFREKQIVLAPQDEVTPPLDTPLSFGLQIKIVRVSEKEVTETEEIPFKVIWQGDPQMPYGREVLVRQGSPGRKEVVYLVKYKDGKEYARKRIGSKIIQNASDEIRRVGRKIEIESYEQGKASWYAYKKCLCAAHPFYPKGSYLRVTNTINGKSVIVKVNDRGPEQAVHPDRLIDLDAEAFKLLAPLSLGTIPVRVEKIKTD